MKRLAVVIVLAGLAVPARAGSPFAISALPLLGPMLRPLTAPVSRRHIKPAASKRARPEDRRPGNLSERLNQHQLALRQA
jgi:hypothetical protein